VTGGDGKPDLGGTLPATLRASRILYALAVVIVAAAMMVAIILLWVADLKAAASRPQGLPQLTRKGRQGADP
jgi:hypothetical protein